MSHHRQNYLIYDGDCGFCDASIRLAARYDREGHFRFIPSQSLTPAQLARLGLRHADCAGAVQVVTPAGTVLAGAHAINQFLRQRRPGAMLVRLLEALPPLLLIELALYRLVARHRQRLSTWFGWRICNLPEPSGPREVEFKAASTE